MSCPASPSKDFTPWVFGINDCGRSSAPSTPLLATYRHVGLYMTAVVSLPYFQT